MDKIDVISKMRTTNRRGILRLIRQSGAISRVQLAQKLRLSKSTITENIAPLLQNGVVQEVGVGSSQITGGRRPVLLRINGSYRYMVAAELGLHQPIFALTDLNGKVLVRRTLSIPYDAPYATRLRITKECIRYLIREGGIAGKSPAIIALSSPGAYSASEKAFVLNPEFKNWNVNQLTQDLEQTFGTNVFRVNDLNAAAMGEYNQGAGKGVRSMLFLSCGMGVGVGMVLDGKLFAGSSGSAGEIAQVRAFGGKPLRAQVEILSLVERLQREAPASTLAAFGQPASKLDFDAVVHLWRENDPFIRDSIEQVAKILGEAVSFALSLLNCELVVFGGDYLVFEEQILPKLNSVVRREAFDPVRVVPSVLRQDAGLQGLVSLAADALLDRIALEREA